MPEADWTWSDVEADVAPRTDSVDLVLDGQVAADLEEAKAALAAAKKGEDTLDGTAVAEAQAEVDRLEEVAHRSVRTFTVRSIGYRRWRELLDASPPQREGERWDASTFIPAVLLAACDQFRSPAEVDQAMIKLSTGQVAKLFGKARVVNEGDDRVPTLRGR